MNWLWKLILPDKVFNRLKLDHMYGYVVLENGIAISVRRWFSSDLPAIQFRIEYIGSMLAKTYQPRWDMWARMRHRLVKTLNINIRIKLEAYPNMPKTIVASQRLLDTLWL